MKRAGFFDLIEDQKKQEFIDLVYELEGRDSPNQYYRCSFFAWRSSSRGTSEKESNAKYGNPFERRAKAGQGAERNKWRGPTVRWEAGRLCRIRP